MRRRDFIKLSVASTTGAVLFAGCDVSSFGNGDPQREFKIQSPVMNPVDMVYRRDNWYATVCSQCDSGCGTIVRVFEGRAKKVDGNPNFPTNLGGSCPRAQAGVQEVYHPDRIGGPMRLSGSRGSGKYDLLKWDDALNQAATLIKDASGTPGSILLITDALSGFEAMVANRFASAVGGRWVGFEPEERLVLREAMRRVFGTDRLPTLDLANARFLVSFSADFLQGWISPVQFSRGYGDFRQGRPDVRGTHFHVSPRLDGSGANADRWIPIAPGTEGAVALAMANVMAAEGLVDRGLIGRAFSGMPVDQYTPDRVASMAGVSADQIRDLARRFAGEKPSVAIAGTSAAAHTNGLFNVAAVFALNYLSGSVNAKGGLILNPPSALPSDIPATTPSLTLRDWQGVINDLNSGKIKLVLLYGANPVYGLPASLKFADALGKAKVVSFSSFMDETTILADLILPSSTSLETWGFTVPDPGPGYQIVGLQQPVIQPFVNSRGFGDALIQLAGKVGGAAQGALPWPSAEDAVRATIDTLRSAGRGNVTGVSNPKEYFAAVQAQGGWWDTGTRAPSAPSAPSKPVPAADPQFEGDPGQFPYYLLPYPQNALGYGESAHLPWMQALPEPISTNVWTTWVEVNPQTADKLGVSTGDVVKVTTPAASVELPVYVNPAARPDVISIPMGQGHTSYGRYAEKRGTNPLDLVAAGRTDSETGALAWAATRVRLEKVDRRVRIPRFEGQVPAYQTEERIVRVTRGKTAE